MAERDMRKKLVELLGSVSCNGNGESLGSCPDRKYGRCGEMANLSYCVIQNTANHLIANGVTVQRWIPVTEEMPPSNTKVEVSALDTTFGKRHTLMAAHVGHHEATTEEYGWREYEGDTEYDEENDCFWIPECWWEVNAVEDNGNWIIDSDYTVTHWRHLPEPPKGD